MPLFGHHHDAPPPPAPVTVPDLAEAAAAWGWTAAGPQPYDGTLTGSVHDLGRTLYGLPRRPPEQRLPIGDARYTDAFRGMIDGRTVIVANVVIPVELNLHTRTSPHVSVCAIELPTLAAPLWIQPRDAHGTGLAETPTGDAAFDSRFRVAAGAPMAMQLVTPELCQRIGARDDWLFFTHRTLWVSLARGPYQSVPELSQRVTEVAGVVAALPEAIVPREVDHSVDDLAERIERLDSAEDAIAFLTGLTPADRERLARSQTPLAHFADVRTPQEAMMRLQTLDVPQRMQLLSLFNRPAR